MKQKIIVTEPAKYVKQASKRVLKSPELNRLVMISLPEEDTNKVISNFFKTVQDKVAKDPELSEEGTGKITATETPSVIEPPFYESLAKFDELIIIGELRYFAKMTKVAEEVNLNITFITNLFEFESLVSKAHIFVEGAVIFETLSNYDVKFKLEKQVSMEDPEESEDPEEQEESQGTRAFTTFEEALIQVVTNRDLLAKFLGVTDNNGMKSKENPYNKPFGFFY